jgi:hypothetical protein
MTEFQKCYVLYVENFLKVTSHFGNFGKLRSRALSSTRNLKIWVLTCVVLSPREDGASSDPGQSSIARVQEPVSVLSDTELFMAQKTFRHAQRCATANCMIYWSDRDHSRNCCNLLWQHFG